jgi:hypothetical protein
VTEFAARASKGSNVPKWIGTWDPVTESARKQIVQNVPLPIELLKKRRLALWLASRELAIRANPGSAALWTLSAILAVSFVVTLIVAPGPMTGDEEDLSGVVAGIAAATAFSALVVGALVVPTETAIQFGPGYTSAIANRSGPWAIAGAQVLTMVLLFILSMNRPTIKAATASALIAGFLFSVSWLVGLRQVTSGDPLNVAQREATMKRKNCRKAVLHSRRVQLLFFPRGLRKNLVSHPKIQEHELRILKGFMAHLRAGVSSTLSVGQPSLAHEFWSAQVDCFLDYAADTGGRVGGDSAALGILVSTYTEMVDVALRSGPDMDSMVEHAMLRIDDLIAAPYEHVEYVAVRGRLLDLLESVVDTGWSNDKTALSSGAVTRIGAVGRKLMPIRAAWDVYGTLIFIGETSARARQDGRTHISMACARELAEFVPHLLAGAGDIEMARAAMPRWTQAAKNLLEGWAMAPPRLYEPQAYLIGGISLQGRGLQHQFWDGTWAPGLVGDFIYSVGDVLQDSVAELRDVDDPMPGKINDAVSVLYGLSHRLAAISVDQKLAVSWSALLDELLAKLAGPFSIEVKNDVDLAELVWSIAITSAFIARDAERICGSLEWLREDVDAEGWNPIVAERLGCWSRIASGERPEDVASWVRSVYERTPDPWMVEAPRREGLAPPVNRSMVQAHPKLANAIEAWADVMLGTMLQSGSGADPAEAGPPA